LDIASIIKAGMALKSSLENSAGKDIVLLSENKQPIPSTELPQIYDFSALTWVSEAYTLSGVNKETAIKDALSMNQYLTEAKRLLHSFPSNKFSKSKLVFDPRERQRGNGCTILQITPHTKTGRIAKYPIVLYAFQSDELFCWIYYTQSGEIGKAEIVSWSNRCYVLNLALIDGKLDINTIYTDNPHTGEKQKMYFRP
jgi:hypothetical protein